MALFGTRSGAAEFEVARVVAAKLCSKPLPRMRPQSQDTI
jgi:hypothetical protein